jgi:membrane-associated protease RseP (regulator of RpoE activity)
MSIRTLMVVVVLGWSNVVAWTASAQDSQPPETAMPSFLPQGRSTAFLGVASRPVADGVTVLRVVPDSSAWKLGIEAGDVIEAIDGFQVGLINGATFSLGSEIRRSGETVELRIRDARTGEVATRTASVGGRATNKGSLDTTPRLGVNSRISPQGETIVRVTPESPAASANLQVGDLVTAVDGYPVGSMNGHVYSLASEIRHSAGQCSLTIQRNGQTLQVPVQFTSRPITTATRVHLLVMGLSDDKSIGDGIKGNLQYISQMLEPIDDEFRASFRQIDGDACTARNIIQAVRALQVAPGESIFCYYAGHGAYDPQRAARDDPSGGHFFQIPGGDLLRKTLMDELRAKHARLTVLITDTCNVASDFIPSAGAVQPPAYKEPPIRTLLLRYRGVVDISGTTRGQFGWYISKFGIFTACFVEAVPQAGGTWSGVLAKADALTRETYSTLKKTMLAHADKQDPNMLDSLRKQQTQAPQAFQLDVVLD